MSLNDIHNVLEKEIRGCFDFFWKEANDDRSSKGYGLVVDTTKKRNVASIASIGFGLGAYIIGVERSFISFEDGYERTVGTLKTFKENVSHINGFYAHFVDINTGERLGQCEYSTIDTAIFLMGAIAASQYFKGESIDLTRELLHRTDWNWIVTYRNSKPIFHMAYSPEKGVDDGFSKAKWDLYAEQLMMYILAAGHEAVDPDLALKLYYGFERRIGGYKGYNFVYVFGGALFIHQFTHAFFDFRKYVDGRGMDWFQNSVDATLANKEWCKDQTWSKTMHRHAWGLTASACKDGYKAFGTAPFGWGNFDYSPQADGTVPPCGAAGSMPFTPYECLEALNYFYGNHPQLWGEYGFTDAYNLDVNPPWYASHYIGIDKGISIIMIDNYLKGTVWKYFMESVYIKKAIKVLKFQERDNLVNFRLKDKDY